MMVVLPGRGVSAGFRVLVASEEIHVLGPIASGVWIESLEWSFAAFATGSVQFTPVIGNSGDTNLAALRAGASLLVRSDQTASFGRPGISYQVVAGSQGQGRIFIGRRVHSGALFVLVGIVVGGSNQDVSGVLSLRTVEVVSVGDASV